LKPARTFFVSFAFFAVKFPKFEFFVPSIP